MSAFDPKRTVTARANNLRGGDVEEGKPTVLEWLLYGWLCLNAAVGLWLLQGGATPIIIYGSSWTVWIPPAIGATATALLLWRLLAPNWITLGLAALYYLLQAIEVRLPDALFAFQLGITVKYRITDDPDFVVKLNLLAIACACLYGVAAYHRFEEEGP